MQSWGYDQKIVKKSMFLCFNRILRFEEGYYTSKICDRGYSNVPGAIWKTVPLKPGKYGIFPVFSLFFYPSLSKIRPFHPNKNTFLKLAKQGLSSHKVLMCYL